MIEYKGGDVDDRDQGQRPLGLASERALAGQGRFLWIGETAATARVRGIGEPVRDGLRGTA